MRQIPLEAERCDLHSAKLAMDMTSSAFKKRFLHCHNVTKNAMQF